MQFDSDLFPVCNTDLTDTTAMWCVETCQTKTTFNVGELQTVLSDNMNQQASANCMGKDFFALFKYECDCLLTSSENGDERTQSVY